MRKLPVTSVLAASPPSPATARGSTAVWAGLGSSIRYSTPILLFTSGIAALLYQVLWVKQLSLVVGIDVYAVAIAVSGFFAGLALGGATIGRRADWAPRPFRLLAVLELGTAVLGLGATLALAQAAPVFVRIESVSSPLAWAGVFAMVGVPAILMGATLPVATRALTAGRGAIGATGGQLYAANTAGAIAGALTSVFLLIPLLGVRGTALIAAGINVATALGALALDRSWSFGGVAAGPRETTAATPDARMALALYAMAGAIALGYEVIWSQAIVQFMSTRTFAFAVVLGTYLGGLAAGSAWYSRRADRVRDPWGAFGFLIAAAGMVALLSIVTLGRWLIYAQTAVEAGVLAVAGDALAGMCARFAVAALALMFLPTMLLGAAFPAVLRLATDAGRVGQGVGAVLALNTVGGIVGTLVTGFVLVPALGLVRTLGVLAVAAAAVGVVAVLRGRAVRPRARWATIVLSLTSMLVAAVAPVNRLATLLPGGRTGTLTFYEESSGGTVAVVEQGVGRNRFRRLYVQGVSNSGDAMPSLRYMRLQALLPLLIRRDEPRSAMVIGLGTGITAGALLQFPLERRVVAELLPAVVRAADGFEGNFGAPRAAGLEVRVCDGRRELLRSDARYDLITLEPPPPSAAGAVNLYSSDFYTLAASRLTPGGLVAQWWPLPAQNDEDSRSLARSFLDSFPHVTVWTTELHEMLLVGSREPITLDVPRASMRFETPGVAAALRAVGIASPAALLATWVTDRSGLERYVDGAPPVTDDRPRIEYAGWARPDEITRVLPKLRELRSELPLERADGAFREAVSAERDRLWRFYQAGLYAYGRDLERSAQELRQVVREDIGNPYYRWFAGGGQP